MFAVSPSMLEVSIVAVDSEQSLHTCRGHLFCFLFGQMSSAHHKAASFPSKMYFVLNNLLNDRFNHWCRSWFGWIGNINRFPNHDSLTLKSCPSTMTSVAPDSLVPILWYSHGRELAISNWLLDCSFYQ